MLESKRKWLYNNSKISIMPISSCVWCVVCGVWCVVCGVWCVVCGVWCVVCGVWCVVCVVCVLSLPVYFAQRLSCIRVIPNL